MRRRIVKGATYQYEERRSATWNSWVPMESARSFVECRQSHMNVSPSRSTV